MKKKSIIYVLFILLIQGCIPLNNVHTIDNYELKEGKPKAKKYSKKYTKFIITNNSPHQIIIKFLEDKYKDKPFKRSIYTTSQKLFLDVNINFNVRFILETKQQKYLDLFNLFSKNDPSSTFYEDEFDNPIQDGDYIRYVSITVSDDSGKDYLSKNSAYRDRLIVYLNNLKKEYGIYKTNYKFIDGK